MLTACNINPPVKGEEQLTKNKPGIEYLLEKLGDAKNDKVIVIAHRGDWRNAPENSLQAIKNCIDMGVDMVEIDVRMTKDSILVLMHDDTIDRTTTGKGKVSDWSYDSLQNLTLRNGTLHPTEHKIPTLKEAMNVAKGSILVNLDKSEDHIKEAYNLLKETGTVKQAIFKGKKSYGEVREKYGNLLDSIIYMPIVKYQSGVAMEYVTQFITSYQPVAFELNYDKESSNLFQLIFTIKANNSRLWTNSLWPEQCAGRHDDRAVINPDSAWGVLISNGANMLQTDRPQLLLNYLREKGLHE